jgi:hypothetical protein
MIRALKIAVSVCVGLWTGAGLAHAANKLSDLPADTWTSIPNTKVSGLCPSPFVGGNNGCRAVVESWSGGVYTDADRRMLIWGGGHGDYYGNEVYGFQVDSLAWKLVHQPSRVSPLVDVDQLSDGAPVSRHTYDDLAYIGASRKMFAYGGSRAGNGYGTEVTWTFDLASSSWKNMQSTGPLPKTACCNMSSDYDPVSGKVIFRDPSAVFEYDPTQNKWSQALDWSHDWGPGKSVVVPNRHLFFTIGSGEFLAYDIQAKKNVTSQWVTTGGDSILKAYGPGMAYDSKSDKLVAWAGGGVWVLDLSTKVWSRKTATGGPAAQLEWGTYGRFRYIQEYNVFILVNGFDQDVYFYKLTAGDGTAPVVPVKEPLRGPQTGALILEPEVPGAWPAMEVPLDGSHGTATVSVYDTKGAVLSRQSAGPGRRTLALPGGAKVCVLEAAVPGMKPFRSLIARP